MQKIRSPKLLKSTILKILIINGPNLNLLGKREPHIYGVQSFEDYLEILKARFPIVEIEYVQSNIEGVLIDNFHRVGFDTNYTGIILNAGAYTHTSLALADCISAINVPVVEVHISNIHARETIRHHSFTAAKCVGVIAGLGFEGYALAIQFFMTR